ncbi:hypothetical protein MAR_025271 [Mya arenaria]|uniref:Secreted protein n=1 Tax=Mya arenaria TaxID=6604 RepID=A0ABY7DVH7_MYAAR|nr:hypothetical protein MAR_025271 [Mya arenaria]
MHETVGTLGAHTLVTFWFSGTFVLDTFVCEFPPTGNLFGESGDLIAECTDLETFSLYACCCCCCCCGLADKVGLFPVLRRVTLARLCSSWEGLSSRGEAGPLNNLVDIREDGRNEPGVCGAAEACGPPFAVRYTSSQWQHP